MFGAISESAYDSWLTVGVTTGSIDELSVVGLDLEAWTESTGIESPDGALFWMTPTDAPAGHSVVAQLTVPTGTEWTVTMGAQGISTSGRVYDESLGLFIGDWLVTGIPFSSAGNVSAPVAPPAPTPTPTPTPGGGMAPAAEPYDPDMGMAPAAEPGQPAATPPPPVTPSPAPSPPPPPSLVT